MSIVEEIVKFDRYGRPIVPDGYHRLKYDYRTLDKNEDILMDGDFRCSNTTERWEEITEELLKNGIQSNGRGFIRKDEEIIEIDGTNVHFIIDEKYLGLSKYEKHLYLKCMKDTIIQDGYQRVKTGNVIHGDWYYIVNVDTLKWQKAWKSIIGSIVKDGMFVVQKKYIKPCPFCGDLMEIGNSKYYNSSGEDYEWNMLSVTHRNTNLREPFALFCPSERECCSVGNWNQRVL